MNYLIYNILYRFLFSKLFYNHAKKITNVHSEKGGAYGSGAQQGSDGVWRFYSYRDPNTDKTMDTFQGAVEWATEGNFSAEDLEQAKLAMFQSV